ncbi:MAG TPA: HAMP domain-containing histidine kinase [Dehalococcoidia bacterium]|jgi:signal transduction histidine kinase|nr:HAMP domain-containing histidine kinase [Dehalococcoidia bacterium]
MSLRARLFVTYILVVVLCLGMVALAVTIIVQGQRDRLAMQRLDDMARPIYVQVRSLLRGQVSVGELWANLEEQARRNNVHILLIDGQGNIIREVSPKPHLQRPLEVAPEELPRDLSQPEQGTFVSATGQTFIFAAYPLARLPATREALRLQTLVLAIPRTGALAILASFIRPLLLGGLIALVLSLIVAILFARSIYLPINRVTAAVEKIAQGQYDQKIPEAGPREIRRLARSFNRMASEVKHSQQQLRHFVADVSHQLKSPLTSIQGFAQALLDGTANTKESRLKAATIISEESNRMRRQVEELLELARMQSGQLKMARETVDLGELLEHCQEIFAVQAEEKGVVLTLKSGPEMNVVGDIDRLEQVFNNLLDNAIKNSPPHGEVMVTTSKEKDFIEVRVVDDGPGIPPEQLPYVFERFYQVTGSRSGTGLGLAIAREIVLAHGGSIEARSEPGAGAEFIVRLPSS